MSIKLRLLFVDFWILDATSSSVELAWRLIDVIEGQWKEQQV